MENNFVKQDRIVEVELADGESIHLTESYDTLHRWEKIGFSMLKYYNCDVDPPVMVNMPLVEENADILAGLGIGVVDRPNISKHEWEIYLDFGADNLDDMM